MHIKICVRNLKFPIYIPQIKDFDIVIFSVATDFNLLYDVRDSLKILMAVCCVHIFFEIRVFKNINFVSCESRIRLWYPTRFRDAAHYWSKIIFLRYFVAVFPLTGCSEFLVLQFHLKRFYCLTIVICTICYYSEILFSYKTAPPPYAFGQGTRAVRILARVAQVYVVVQFYPILKIY